MISWPNPVEMTLLTFPGCMTVSFAFPVVTFFSVSKSTTAEPSGNVRLVPTNSVPGTDPARLTLPVWADVSPRNEMDSVSMPAPPSRKKGPSAGVELSRVP